MKKIVCLLLLLSLLTGCFEKSMTERMDEIDSLVVSEQYDSAYASVMRIDRLELRTREDSARYYLLLTQTSILSNHPDTLNRLDSLVIPYYNKVENHEKLADAYYYKAYGKVMEADIADATYYYKAAEEQAALISNGHIQYKIFESLSAINELSGNYLLQLKYAKKAHTTAKAMRNKELEAYACFRISLAYSTLQYLDSALYYINRIMPMIKHVKEEDRPAFLTNAAYTFKYTAPETAKKLLMESLSLKEYSITMEHLADIYYNEGKKEEAYKIWVKALSIDDGNPKDLILHNILEYDMEHGQTDHVCETVNEIIHIKDSMLNSLRNDTIKDLQLRFDHEVAMRQQEQVTHNWQKGVLVAVIIVLLLVAYIVVRRVLEKIRMQEVQMQINDYMGQIRDLEASGKEADEEIAKLRKQLKDYVYKKAPELLQGYKYYVQIKNDEIETLTKANMDKAAEKQFIDYYTALDFRTVNRIKNVKRKEELTTHRLFFLLLVEMGKTDEFIARLFGTTKRSIDVLRTRTKPVEEGSA